MTATKQPRKKPSWMTRLGTLFQSMSEEESSANARQKAAIPKPWPGVLPADKKEDTLLAMDNAIQAMGEFAFSMGGWDSGGFLGYAFLAELSQITEYRRPAEILAGEVVRKWGKLVSSSDDPQTKEKLKKLTDDMIRFNVKGVVQKAFELDNFFGVGHVYIDVGKEGPELKNPLLLDKVKIGVNELKAFRTVEPMWTYPNLYNSRDPLKDDFYNPESWFVMGTEVHKSRIMRFISRPLPDMLKPPYLFGGVSLTQLLVPYVNNWLRTRQSVSDITHNFSTPVLSTDMDQMTTTQGAANLAMRAQVYNAVRDNQGLMVCDKEKEKFEIVSASLGSLDALQAQAIEQQAFPSGIPLVKLLGVTPSGLNASSDGEVRVFYDTVASMQEKVGTPHLKTMIEVIQLNRYGEIDPGITWEWAELWELSEKEKAEVRKTEAEIDVIYMEGGIIDPQAILDRLNKDPQSMYAGLNLTELPEPPEALGEGGEGEEPMQLTQLMGSPGARAVVSAEEKEKKDAEKPRRPEEAQPARRAETAEERGTREARQRSERRSER